MELINQDPPAISGKEVLAAIEASVAELGLSSKHMVSRAYHDSTFMAQVSHAYLMVNTRLGAACACSQDLCMGQNARN